MKGTVTFVLEETIHVTCEGHRLTKGDEVELELVPPAPDSEGVPCAEAIGSLLRIGDDYYPARDIRHISSYPDFGMYISFHDSRTAKHVRVEDPKTIVEAWDTALRAATGTAGEPGQRTQTDRTGDD